MFRISSILISLSALSALNGSCSTPPFSVPSDGATTVSDSGSVATATILSADCRFDSPELLCQRVLELDAGALGSGTAIDTDDLGGGFIDAASDRLVIAASGRTGGRILAIDLSSGVRTVLSGAFPEGEVVGVGTAFSTLFDVKRDSSTGDFIALGRTDEASLALVAIDPSTGDRTLIFEPGRRARVVEGSQIKCPSYYEGAHEIRIADSPSASLAVGEAGDIYLAATDDGFANYLVSIQAGECTVLSESGSPDDQAGGGPALAGGTLSGLEYSAGAIWAAHALSDSVLSIDPATGQRSIHSSATTGEGPTAGSASLLIETDAIWAAGHWLAAPYVTQIDPTTGSRTELQFDKSVGPLASLYADPRPRLWRHPTMDILVMKVAQAIVLYDPAAHQSNSLSR